MWDEFFHLRAYVLSPAQFWSSLSASSKVWCILIQSLWRPCLAAASGSGWEKHNYMEDNVKNIAEESGFRFDWATEGIESCLSIAFILIASCNGSCMALATQSCGSCPDLEISQWLYCERHLIWGCFFCHYVCPALCISRSLSPTHCLYQSSLPISLCQC